MKKRFQTLLKLGVFAAIVMYLFNKLIDSSTNNLSESGEENYFSGSHGKVFYRKSGTGSPVLLLHDLSPFSSSYEWNSIEKDLGKQHTVYVLDLPGCGHSDKEEITYVNYNFVQLIAEFTEEVIKEKTELIATGISGSFAVMAAGIHKNLFSKITLVNPESPESLACIPDSGSKALCVLMGCPILGCFLYNIIAAKTQIEYLFTEKYFYNSFRVTEEMKETYYQAAHEKHNGGRFLLSSLKGNYVNVNVNQTLKNLEQPIHLILGQEHPHTKHIARSYSKLNSNVKCTFISKTKMLPQLEAPDRFLEAYYH